MPRGNNYPFIFRILDTCDVISMSLSFHATVRMMYSVVNELCYPHAVLSKDKQ